MADDLDLTTGDPSAEESSGSRRRSRRRERSSGDKGDSSNERRDIAGVRGQLDRVLDRIAKMLRERDDAELAEVIEDDGKAMASGIVRLITAVPFLTFPIILILNLVEPVLAFGRVGRILSRRVRNRLAARAQARADAQAEWQAAAEAQAEAEAAGAAVAQ